MAKLLFLDVDGVLNTTRARSLYSLSKPCLHNLQGIVEDTGCEIILSSTWRLLPEARKRLERVLSYRGISLAGATPFQSGEPRGKEIEAFLFANNLMHCSYAIIDDDSDMLNYQLSHFFQTDGDYGLTKTIAYRVTQYLNT